MTVAKVVILDWTFEVTEAGDLSVLTPDRENLPPPPFELLLSGGAASHLFRVLLRYLEPVTDGPIAEPERLAGRAGLAGTNQHAVPHEGNPTAPYR